MNRWKVRPCTMTHPSLLVKCSWWEIIHPEGMRVNVASSHQAAMNSAQRYAKGQRWTGWRR